MATNQNILQDKFECLDCGEIFKNARELEIHSFMHSSCGEIILPLFKTSHANSDNGISKEEWESVKSTLCLEVPGSKKINTVHSSSITSSHSNPTLKDCVQEMCTNPARGHSMCELPFFSVYAHICSKVKNRTDIVKHQTDIVKHQTDIVKHQTDIVKHQTGIVKRRRPWLRCDICQERFASALGLEKHKCTGPLLPIPGLKKRKVFFSS